ncbi:MAG: DNA/RNA non-specific endonuclease [Zoogloeaceae bacterium]|nr:DNA/RNA non-specific endonuclease [Zoogloeaceae bacterium]
MKDKELAKEEETRKREAEKTAQSQQANQHIADGEGQFIVTNITPDFCRVGDSVIPFDISRTLDHECRYVPNVFARGERVLTIDSVIHGNVGNAGSGVNTGVSRDGGYDRVLTGAKTVRANGRPITRDGDLVLMNGSSPDGPFNALGELHTLPRGSAQSEVAGGGEEVGGTDLLKTASEFGAGVVENGKEVLGTLWHEVNGAALELKDIGVDVLKTAGEIGDGIPTYLGFGFDNLAVDATREKVHSAVGAGVMRIFNMMDKLPVYLGFGGSSAAVDEVQDQVHGALREGFDVMASNITKARDERGFLASWVRSMAEIGPYVMGVAGGGRQALKTALKPDGKPEAPKTPDAPEKAPGAEAKDGVKIEPKVAKVVTRNGYTYHLDEQGRVLKVEGDLKRNPAQGRNMKAQKNAGGEDHLPTDQGGHYIGRRFDGPMDDFNHFAQDGNFNNGAYKRLENSLDKMAQEGKTVRVEITPTYPGTSLRPDTITVRYWVDGKLQPVRRYGNNSGGVLP